MFRFTSLLLLLLTASSFDSLVSAKPHYLATSIPVSYAPTIATVPYYTTAGYYPAYSSVPYYTTGYPATFSYAGYPYATTTGYYWR